MFTDERRCKVWEQIRQHDLRVFGKFLPSSVFGEAARNAGVRLGNSALALPTLVMLGLAAAFHRTKSFAAVLVLTVKLLQDSEQWCDSPLAAARRNARRAQKRRGKKKRSKHDPRGGDPTGVTEEAFVQARQRMPLSFWAALLMLLAERFQEAHGKQLRWHEFRLIALDGTTVNLPNWQVLRDHFGSAKNGKSWRAQARMVMLQFPLARLPFRYELGTLAEGERAVASRLLAGLCCNDLVLMDQGFWSYRLFRQIDQQHAYFAIRRFAQARLRTVKRLGPKDRLVEWRPSDPRQRRRLAESICLRVIDYQIKGFRPTGIVTNVLDPAAYSPRGLDPLGHQGRRGSIAIGPRTVSSSLGNRNHLLRVESHARHGNEPAFADSGGHCLRGCGARIALLPGAVADGRGGRYGKRRSAADQLQTGIGRVARHCVDSDHHPARSCCPRVAPATSCPHRIAPCAISTGTFLRKTARWQNQKPRSW